MTWASAFAAPVAKPAMQICSCTHPLSDHCKSGVKHSYYKDEMRMTRTPRAHLCATRHCTQPLCSCIDFKPGEN